MIGGFICITPDCFGVFKEETFEEKYNKMEMDKFIKEYPMFSNIERIISLAKTGNRIFSNEIIKY